MEKNTVIISEKQLLTLKNGIEEAAPEVDEYTIGDEGSNPPFGGNSYHTDERNNVNENLECEVEPSEIDLSSFRRKDELVPKIWENGLLTSRVRLKLLDIADDFWKFVDLNWVKPKGIILTGSICNFNWSKFSDIDLHLIVDFNDIDEKTEFVKAYLDSKKNEWNDEHEGLMIFDHPVELYTQNVGEMPKSSGIYDLEQNEWITKPNKDDIKTIKLDKFEIKDKAANIMTIIDGMYDALHSTSDSYEIDKIGEDSSILWGKVKEMRRNSLETQGESGVGNIVYKILRRTNYLDKLFDLMSIVYDKSNSITEGIKPFEKTILLLKEEGVYDGNSSHNPYKKRWDAERKALKDFICNYGKVMSSKENGKTYKVYYDKTLSQLVGYNYCICLQWDQVELKPKSILYIRALDKFTDRVLPMNFDTRGRDNTYGTNDDLRFNG